VSDDTADRPTPDPVVDEVTEGAIPVPATDPPEEAATVPVAPPPLDSPPDAPAAVPPPSLDAETFAPPAGPATAGSDPGASATAASGPFPPDRPERKLGAAFAGGLLLALVLKRLVR
jgi:hypothetical protein